MKYSMCLSVSPAKFAAVPFKGGFAQDIHTIAKLGFDGVELAVRDPRVIDQEAILAGVKDLGLSIAAVSTGQAWGEEGLSYTDPDRDIREQAIQRTCLHFDFAQKSGAVVIIGLLRGKLKQGVTEGQAFEWMYDAFSRCCDQAEKYGVRIAFEAINRYETSLLNTVEEGLEFIERVGAPGFGMLLDTFHMNIEEPSIEKSISTAGDRMFHFHYADSNRNYPGCGHLNFPAILQAVKDTGYSGFLSGEHRPIPDPVTSAEQGLRFLQDIEQTNR